MKRYIFIFFIVVLQISCSEKSNHNTDNITRIEKRDTVKSENNFPVDQPDNAFIDLAKYIDSSGYSPDSVHIIKKVKYPGSSQKEMLGGTFFYKMKFENTPLFLNRDPSKYVIGADYCALDINKFKSCGKIWAYAYVKNGTAEENKYNPAVDGFIEEFDFPDSSSVRAALKEIDRKKSLIFFHTHSFCCSLRNSVFVFNTIGGFDAALKEFFDHFTKNSGVKVSDNIPCYEE